MFHWVDGGVHMRTRQRINKRNSGRGVVGSIVELTGGHITGVIVDLVLDQALSCIEYVVVAFDAGLGEAMIYQPVSWHLLRPTAGGFSVSAVKYGDELPAELHIDRIVYGGNCRHQLAGFVPTPQSRYLH
jgi:hypothetical protein